MSASPDRRTDGSPRVLVVGGGIAGLSIAFRLMQRGARVCVIDAGLAGGASRAAAGMLPPALEAFGQAGAHPDLPKLLFAARSAWRAFAAELSDRREDALGYRTIGTLATATDTVGSRRLEDLARIAVEFGERVELLDGAGARALAPGLSAAVSCALYFPDDALVEPPRAIAALSGALIKGGARIQFGRKAVKIVQTQQRVALSLDKGNDEHADAIVIAPGWGGADLAPELAAMFPVKGQILTLSGGAVAPQHMLRGEGIYLAPRADGRVEVGATNERGIETPTIEPEAIMDLHHAAASLFPVLGHAQVLASRVGIRPGSPDHAPLLGRSAKGDRIFLAAALHRNGVLLAPLIADALADAVLGESRNSASMDWLRRFDGGRFANA